MSKIKLTFAFVTVFLLITSCNENFPGKAILLGVSECKSFQKSAELFEKTDSVSCIEYTYDKTIGVLRIEHINAGFNCCPGEIKSDIYFRNDTLFIEESESSNMCDCNCLYDLEFEISEFAEGNFTLKIIEPYIGDNEELIFSIDLKANESGEYCVSRKNYPWGMI